MTFLILRPAAAGVLVAIAALLAATVGAYAQAGVEIQSEKAGRIRISQTALPVISRPVSQAEKADGALSPLTEKPAPTQGTRPGFFCSTPNGRFKPREKFDVKAVGALHCGADDRSPCYWKKPFVLVGFINGTPDLKKIITDVIAEWTTWANVGFVSDDNENFPGDTADIKILFTDVAEYNSFVGTDAWRPFLRTSKDTPTMRLGFLNQVTRNPDGTIVNWVRGTILHEFGHALGLMHEHQNPAGGVRWNRSAVIRDLSGPPNSWDLETIENNIFRALAASLTQYTQYDPSSVMHYSFPATWTLDGVSIPQNDDLSETDKKFIAGVYPRTKQAIDTSRFYQLTAWHSNRRNCLTVAGSRATPENGFVPYFTGCNGRSNAQWWKFTPVGGGDYRLTNYVTGDALSLSDVGFGALPEMRASGNYSGQFWTVTALGDHRRLSSTLNGIMYSFTADPQPNTRPFMWRTGHWANQLWDFIPVG